MMNVLKTPTQALPNLEIFATIVESLAAVNKNIIAVTSDSRGSGKLGTFGQNFQFGKGSVIREGSDMTFIGTGETVLPAFEAAEKLAAEHGIQSKVISMHTIKP